MNKQNHSPDGQEYKTDYQKSTNRDDNQNKIKVNLDDSKNYQGNDETERDPDLNLQNQHSTEYQQPAQIPSNQVGTGFDP